jgi:hypothetical protein
LISSSMGQWGFLLFCSIVYQLPIGGMICIIIHLVYTEISSIIKEEDDDQVRRYQA